MINPSKLIKILSQLVVSILSMITIVQNIFIDLQFANQVAVLFFGTLVTFSIISWENEKSQNHYK